MEGTENKGNESFGAKLNLEANLEQLKPRKFLKRGEGIKKRFGIDPAELRIDNLPPYNYIKNNGQYKLNSQKTTGKIKVNTDLSSTPRSPVDQKHFVCARNVIDKRQMPLGWAKDLVDDCMTTITPIKILEDLSYNEQSENQEIKHNPEVHQEENQELDDLKSKSHLSVHFEEETLNTPSQQENTNTQRMHLELELQEEMKVLESSNVYEYFNNALLSELQRRLGGINITQVTATDETTETEEEIRNTESFELHENAEEIRSHLAMLKQNLEIFKKDHKKLLELQREFTLKSKRMERDHKAAMKKLEDERIQFEIYMHDEKLNVEKEVRKTTDQAKQKLQKQVTELKKEITELQTQLQQKEKVFKSTEARLRAQMRNWQKERLQLQEQNKELKSIIFQIVQQNAPTKNKLTAPTNKKMTNELLASKNENLAKFLQDNIFPTMSPNIQQINEKDLTIVEPTVLLNSSEETPTQRSAAYCEMSKLEERTDKNLTDFQRQVVNEDGSKNIYYTNGNRKEISADEMLVRMLYFNGDIKETNVNAGSIKYYYARQNVWHTTYLDGLEIIEFPNGQVEHRHKDGLIEVHFPNDSVKIINPSSSKTREEWQFPNGSKLQIQRNGDRILLLPNGQKEEQTKMGKRRVFPDGTVKLVYPDGSQETRYSNGRIRIRDKHGQLVMDSNKEFEIA